MGRILALPCILLKQTACKLHKKSATTVTSTKQLFKCINNQVINRFAATGVAAATNASFLLLSSLQVAKDAKDAKKKT